MYRYLEKKNIYCKNQTSNTTFLLHKTIRNLKTKSTASKLEINNKIHNKKNMKLLQELRRSWMFKIIISCYYCYAIIIEKAN